MAISETARRTHEELFPGHTSTLARTDPELIEVFDNFAFDEVLRHSTLDPRTRLMVQLAALIACNAVREYRAMLGAALDVGVTPVEAKEIVYQAVPYVGMGIVFDVVHVTNEVLTERGIELPLLGQSTTNPQTRAERGLAVQKQIVTSGSTPSTRRLLTTNSTSRVSCPRTASATTSLAAASACRLGSC